jgi:hypothetical protein
MIVQSAPGFGIYWQPLFTYWECVRQNRIALGSAHHFHLGHFHRLLLFPLVGVPNHFYGVLVANVPLQMALQSVETLIPTEKKLVLN